MDYFTVGPTQMYPIVPTTVRRALKDGVTSMSHRNEEYITLHKETVSNLKIVLSIPATHSIFFLSSGTEAMERIIQNTVQSRSHHLVNGSFSERFYQTAVELGKKPTKTEATYGASFDLNHIQIPSGTELICATHNETSTGVMVPLQKLYDLKRSSKTPLLALDTVSSMPYVDVDYSQVDMTFFSVQKGFGMPAGLGVLIVSEQALKHSAGSYHSFASLSTYAKKYQTPETPNVLAIYTLNEVVKDMLKKGIKSIRQDIDKKSDMIAAYIKSSTTYDYLVTELHDRSKTIHVLKVKGGSARTIKLLKQKGFAVSSGYGDMKADFIRISNFPCHKVKDIKNLLENM